MAISVNRGGLGGWCLSCTYPSNTSKTRASPKYVGQNPVCSINIATCTLLALPAEAYGLGATSHPFLCMSKSELLGKNSTAPLMDLEVIRLFVANLSWAFLSNCMRKLYFWKIQHIKRKKKKSTCPCRLCYCWDSWNSLSKSTWSSAHARMLEKASPISSSISL